MKILIVEDNYENSLLLKTQIGKSFKLAEIESVSNGLEALKKISAINFDILIIDLIMPDLNGLDLAKRIEKDKGLKIAYTATRFQESFLDHFDVVVIKPFVNNWKKIFDDQGHLITEKRVWNN